MKNASRPSQANDYEATIAWCDWFIGRLPLPRVETVEWPDQPGSRVTILRDIGIDGHSGNKLRKWLGLKEYLLEKGIRKLACPGSLASYNLAALAHWAPQEGFDFTAFVKLPETRLLSGPEQYLLDHQGKYAVQCVSRNDWREITRIQNRWGAQNPDGVWVPEGICYPVPAIIGACMAYGVQISEIPDWDELILDAGTGFTSLSIAAGIRQADDRRPVRIVPLMGKMRIDPDDFPVDWLGALPVIEPVFRGYRKAETLRFMERWVQRTGETLPAVYAAPLFTWFDRYLASTDHHTRKMIIHSGG